MPGLRGERREGAWGDVGISDQEGALLFTARVRSRALPGRWVSKEVCEPCGVLLTMQIPGFP